MTETIEHTATLVSAALTGDEAAFMRLVDSHKEAVFAIAVTRIGDFDSASDIAQEVLLQAYISLHRLQDPARFSGWLWTIAENRCRTWLARRQQQPAREVFDTTAPHLSAPESPDRGLERGEPPQANFSMKSRSLPKLLGHVEEWHEQLARDTRVYTGRSWAPSCIGSFKRQDSEYDPPLDWTVHEILEGRELIVEGKRMNHCIASYANNCRRGNTSIWSMQVQEKGEQAQQIMTIAVQNRTRHISQARGRRNALPKLKGQQARRLQVDYKQYLGRSRHVLSRWMDQEDMTMGSRHELGRDQRLGEYG